MVKLMAQWFPPDGVNPGSRVVSLGKTWVVPGSRERVMARVLDLIGSSVYESRLLLTVNLVQVHQARHAGPLQEAFERASIVTADGWPIALACRLLCWGDRTERITGSDLMPLLVGRDLRVALIGGTGAAAELAFPAAPNIVCRETAPRAEILEPSRRMRLIERIVQSQAEVIFVGLPVPIREELALELLDQLPSGVVACTGAAVDFAAGTRPRAPRALRWLGLEWAHRIAVQPREMLPRYAVAAPYFLGVLGSEFWRRVRSETRRARR